MNRHFSKKIHKYPISTLKRCSISLAIKEMQFKTTMRYSFTPTRMVIIKETVTSIDNDVEKFKPSHIAGGNVKS